MILLKMNYRISWSTLVKKCPVVSLMETNYQLQKSCWKSETNLLVDTSSLRAKTFMASSKTEVTFSPICMAWTEKLHKHQKYAIIPTCCIGKIYYFIKRKIKGTILVIYVTDGRKVMTLHFIHTSSVKRGKNFSNWWNSCMFKDVIDFHEPTFKFVRMKLEI